MKSKNADADLLVKINAAVKAANEAETKVTTAQAELVSRSKAVGLLLLEAKKRHPAVKDFETFLKKVDGLKLSRAYGLLRLAGGRTTDEELKKEARDRKRKSRASKKALPATPTPKPEPLKLSVTTPHVTESPEVSIEERKAQHANLDSEEPSAKTSAEAQHSDTNKDALDDPLVLDRDDEIEATPWFASKIKPIFDNSVENDEVKSALALAEFKRACATFLPQLTIKDLQAAQYIFDVISDLKFDVEHAKFEAKYAAAEAKRIKWEASHPKEAKDKARERAQANAMEDDIQEAKVDARKNGEPWGDIKDEWIEQWTADYWGAEQEAAFEKKFQEQWAREHGVTHEKAA